MALYNIITNESDLVRSPGPHVCISCAMLYKIIANE